MYISYLVARPPLLCSYHRRQQTFPRVPQIADGPHDPHVAYQTTHGNATDHDDTNLATRPLFPGPKPFLGSTININVQRREPILSAGLRAGQHSGPPPFTFPQAGGPRHFLTPMETP